MYNRIICTKFAIMDSEELLLDSLNMATLLLLLRRRQQLLKVATKILFEPERPLIPTTRLNLDTLDVFDFLFYNYDEHIQIINLILRRVWHNGLANIVAISNGACDSLCEFDRRCECGRWCMIGTYDHVLKKYSFR